MNSKPESIQQLDPKKVLISTLNTRQPTVLQVSELMASITASGQVSPAVARPHPKKAGHYELAAGARRKVACQALGITLDTIVRAIPDGEFEDMILTDNLQREAPDPMQEALLIERRIAAGAAPSEVAARYGKSETWLKRRMKLLGLTAAAREACHHGGDLFHFSTEMLEFVGSLPEAGQTALLDSYHTPAISSLKELTDHYHRSACDLEKAANWLHDPATFIPGCGPGCAHNSAETLFPDETSPCGSCLAIGCFRQRAALAQDAAITTALAGQPLAHFTLFAGNYSSKFTYQNQDHKLLTQWEHREKFKTLKKPREGAKLALDLSDPFAPKVCYLLPKHGTATDSTTTAAASPHETRAAKLTAKRLAALNVEIDNDLNDAKIPAGVSLLKLAAAFGMDRSHTTATVDGRAWASLDSAGEVPLDTYSDTTASPEQAVWLSIRPILRQRLSFQTHNDLLKDHMRAEMQRVATLIGTDYEAKWLKVCGQVPVPKSWGPGIDPITLQLSTPEARAKPLRKGKGKGTGTQTKAA